MLPPAEIREELTVRAFALIKAFLAGDLVALDALVDDDTELIPVLMEILVGALLKLVSVEELSRLRLGLANGVFPSAAELWPTAHHICSLPAEAHSGRKPRYNGNIAAAQVLQCIGLPQVIVGA